MKEEDPNLVAVALSQMNAGGVPPIDLLNDPSSVALLGLKPVDVNQTKEKNSELTEEEQAKLK